MSERNRSFDGACSRRVLLCLGMALILLGGMISSATVASAQSQARLLDAPRASGLVGERYDGYAVARGPVSPDIASLIDQVNAERRALYEQRAKAEGVPVEALGKIYAAQIVKSAPAGTWFLSDGGQWTRK